MYMYMQLYRSALQKTKTELATVQLQYVQACKEREDSEEKMVCISLVLISSMY